MGRDYLLWKSEWYDLSEQQARRNTANVISITVEMLTGEGQHLDQSQAYQQMNICAMKTWSSLPTAGAKSEEFNSVWHRPNELYQDFVSHLLQAVSRTVSDAETGRIIARL